MENQITIRRAEGRDLDDILRLTAQLCQEEKENYDKDWDMEWVYGQGKEIIKNDLTYENSFIAVAELDGNVFAFLRGSLYWDGWMSWKKGKGAELWDFIIEEGLRNRGVGSKLMNMFFEWCKQKDVSYVLLNVSVENARGIEFYKKFGFGKHQIIMEKKLK
jgi:ribosomal protein S18 acetylase RimI-like enzyme